MAEFDSVFLGAFLGGMFTFAAGYLLHFVVDGIKRRNELRKMAESIISELEGLQTYIYGYLNDESPVKGTFYKITLVSIESAMYSGLFKEYGTATQRALITVQSRTKLITDLNYEALIRKNTYKSPEEMRIISRIHRR